MKRKQLKQNTTINPNLVKVRDERVYDMLTTTGGITRVFPDRKRRLKADKSGRKTTKHKKKFDQ